MATPTFDGFSLQDGTYITTDVEYRSMPSRSIDAQKISRKPGVKLLSHDFAERKVRIIGYIIGTSASDLQSKIDNLNTQIIRKDSGQLSIDTGRTATATATTLAISDPAYSQDYVPFDLEFILADPFFYGVPQSVSWPITTATSYTCSTTISGSVFAEPMITYQAPNSGADPTAIRAISLTYASTGEITTWSGSTGTGYLAKNGTVAWDFANQLIVQGSTYVTTSGVFARWEPGSTTFNVDFTGAPTTGGTLTLTYQPRYL